MSSVPSLVPRFTMTAYDAGRNALVTRPVGARVAAAWHYLAAQLQVQLGVWSACEGMRDSRPRELYAAAARFLDCPGAPNVLLRREQDAPCSQASMSITKEGLIDLISETAVLGMQTMGYEFGTTQRFRFARQSLPTMHGMVLAGIEVWVSRYSVLADLARDTPAAATVLAALFQQSTKKTRGGQPAQRVRRDLSLQGTTVRMVLERQTGDRIKAGRSTEDSVRLKVNIPIHSSTRLIEQGSLYAALETALPLRPWPADFSALPITVPSADAVLRLAVDSLSAGWRARGQRIVESFTTPSQCARPLLPDAPTARSE